jgi:hypothetical protein
MQWRRPLQIQMETIMFWAMLYSPIYDMRG